MILVKSFMIILLLFFIYYFYDKTQKEKNKIKESFTDIKNIKKEKDVYLLELNSKVNELIKLKEKASEIVAE